MIASSFLFVVESRKNSKVKIWRWGKMCMLRCQIWFTQLVKWYMDFKKCMHYSESYIWGNRFTACKNGSLLTLAQFLGFFLQFTQVLCVYVCDTWVGGVNPEALVPEATQEDEAVISCDDETLRADLNALIQEVGNLTPMTAHVIGCRGKKTGVK